VKILVDACVAGSAAPALRDAGHVVESVTDWPADPGDAVVLAHAASSEQIVLTLDKDFGELAIVRGLPHAGIIRLVDCPAAQQGQRAVAVIAMYADELRQGAIVTAEPGRTRVRLKSR
jgi:predicted nuclease of predicted toxin-antitoxin system